MNISTEDYSRVLYIKVLDQIENHFDMLIDPKELGVFVDGNYGYVSIFELRRSRNTSVVYSLVYNLLYIYSNEGVSKIEKFPILVKGEYKYIDFYVLFKNDNEVKDYFSYRDFVLDSQEIFPQSVIM